VSARAAIAEVADRFVETDDDVVSDDPLRWPGYATQRRRARDRSGETEAVICGRGRIGRTEVAIIAFDFAFMGGSMGEATGRRVTNAITRARTQRRPVMTLVSSGGCRMQEGMTALVQMQRIAAACHDLRTAGLPHISVVRHPTTGGVWAALAAGADVILAERGATVAFAGRRVRREDADEASTADGQHAVGQVDMLVDPSDLRRTVALLLDLLAAAPAGAPAPAEIPPALGRDDLPPDGWTAVQRARDPERPRAAEYLERYFEARFPISGDRAGGTDPGMLCGIGRRHGRTIAYAAQAGTATTPAGFRTAARLIRLADRLTLPILTLIDTPGAANDPAAERAGLGAAINELLAAVAGARVPISTLVIGEGGSGGALALASPTSQWIAPDAYFSVIAPEAATAILKHNPDRAPTIADRLRLRPQDLLELGIVAGIARRPLQPARAAQRHAAPANPPAHATPSR
jgi:acetyl-CoA carboxylase beta subunit